MKTLTAWWDVKRLFKGQYLSGVFEEMWGGGLLGIEDDLFEKLTRKMLAAAFLFFLLPKT